MPDTLSRCRACGELHDTDMVDHIITRHRHDAHAMLVPATHIDTLTAADSRVAAVIAEITEAVSGLQPDNLTDSAVYGYEQAIAAVRAILNGESANQVQRPI
jgi:hypothetical protein